MKRLRNKLLTRLNTLLASLLGLIGFSGCNFLATDYGVEEPVEKYGVPYSTLHVDGQVNNLQEQPLENIRAVIQLSEDHEGDTLYTDQAGQFSKHYEGYLPVEQITVQLADTSGQYTAVTLQVPVSYTGGDGSWNYGNGTAEIRAKME